MSEGREHQPAGRRTYRIAGLPNRPSPALNSAGHVDDLVAAYALNALEPDETALVDAHVRVCPLCERALSDAMRTVSMLPFLAPMHTPPADSKVALFARVAHAQKATAASPLPLHGLQAFRTPTIPASADYDDLVQPPATSPAVEASAAVAQSRTGRLVSVLSVPLVVALVMTGFWGLQLRDQLAVQRSQVADLQSQLTNFGSGTTSYQLQPGTAAPQAEGQIVLGADQRAGMVQIDVNTDKGPKKFEMMVVKDGKLVPVSEVTVDQDGQGQAHFELDQPLSEYESVHIQAKPLDASPEASRADTLFQDNSGPLGSTGSSLDIGP
ncbi:MAG: zf-HC2 domain-containing protein [Thermomicrobiales bacterium]|nr:zf-HC2 domain-containing protein [Thermomicrobiales bacterium]